MLGSSGFLPDEPAIEKIISMCDSYRHFQKGQILTFCLHILHVSNLVVYGENLALEPLIALFSFNFLPPLSVVFRAPDFHGSGVIIRPSFFSHFSQTIV